MGQSSSSSSSSRREENGEDQNNNNNYSDDYDQEHQPSSFRRIGSESLFRGNSASSLLAMAAAAEWEANAAANNNTRSSSNSFTTTPFGTHDILSGVASSRATTENFSHHHTSSNIYDAATIDVSTFVPTSSQHEHEWMGRSIETLVLGHVVAPTRILEDIDDMISDSSSQQDTSTRRGSMSTRGSLDFLVQRRGSLELGVREPRNTMMQGGTLAQYYHNRNNGSNHQVRSVLRQRRTSMSSLSSSHHSPNQKDSKSGPNICLSLLAREVTGHRAAMNKKQPAAERLRQIGGKTLYENLDRPAHGIVSDVQQLEAALNRGDWNETTNLVSRLTPRLMGDPMRQHHPPGAAGAATIDDPTLPSFAPRFHAGGGRLGLERDAFCLGGGVQVLMRVFFVPAFISSTATQDDNDEMANRDARVLPSSLVSSKLASCWNEVLASLRELVYALPILVQNGTILEEGKFLPFLFTLLSHDSLFDAAATLIEEILSLLSHSPPPPIPPDEAPIDGEYRSMNFVVPVSTFFLGNVPDLYSLWHSFNCRQLAHFCRILALLVFEPEDRQLLESPTVLKSLELLQLRRDRAARAGRDATVDMNQAILLGDKVLMQRLLNLLQIMNYAPTLRRSTAYHVMAHFPFISETLVMLGLSEMGDWEDVDRLDALAKKLRGANGETQNLSELGNVADMLESLAGSLQGNSLEPATQLGHIIHVINAAQQARVVVGRRRHQQGGDNGSSIHVSSVPLESSSLDNLASAAMTLNDQVIMRRSGGPNGSDDNLHMHVEVQEDQSPEPSIQQPQYTSSGRLRISIPEDAANELQFNALLLAPYQVEVLFVLCTLLGGRRKIDAQRFLKDHGLIPTMDDMFHRLSFGAAQVASRSSSGSDATASVSNSEVSGDEEDQPAGIHGPGCECTPESALSVQYLRLLHNFCDRDCDNYAARRLLLSEDERQYVFSGRVWLEGEKPAGLREGLFSKVIGAFFREPDDSPYRFWLASCAESYLRGSSPHEQLFAAKSGLLHHLVKDIISDRVHCAGSLQTSFDLLGEACKSNSEVLHLLVSSLDEETFRKLMSAAAANLVDSNVFLRSLLLTVERISASRLFKSVEAPKSADPWRDHDYGPWTGHSGTDTRFYLTHSWWDASILPTENNSRDKLKAKSANEESYDDARSSDWFPPGFTTNQAAILGESIPSGETSPIDATVGYNGWLFSPPTMRLSVYDDPLAWALGDAAFQPNTIERLAWFLITNQSRMLRDLLCVVDLRNINHENICCLNTAVVVAMFASRRNQLSGLLHELKRLDLEEQEAAARRSEARRKEETVEGTMVKSMKLLDIVEYDTPSQRPRRSLQRLPSVLGDRTDVLRNFRELLWFWSEYYTHRGRDRLSLEFSSHMRFQEWYKVVLTLTEDDGSNTALVRRPVKLPKSPYQRVARIVDIPRRTG